MPVNREVKMVAAKGKSLLATSARITGSECSHADLLGVIRAESQVVAGTNFRLVLKIRRKTGSGCSDNLEQVCTGVMYHRPLGCSESNYATCLKLIREDGINCLDSVLIKVAPLSSDNEDVFGQPRHSVEAVKVAATLREVDPCQEEKKSGAVQGEHTQVLLRQREWNLFQFQIRRLPRQWQQLRQPGGL